jgi:hypothetical protein
MPPSVPSFAATGRLLLWRLSGGKIPRSYSGLKQ